MVKIRPFRAYVAHADYAEEISIPSNHSISVEEGSDYVQRNRISFYKVDRPEFEMSSIVKAKTLSQSSGDSAEPARRADFPESLRPPKEAKRAMSDRKATKDYQLQNTDFSKKHDGYERNLNLRETGQEYREERADPGRPGGSKGVCFPLGKKLGTQDDISLRSQQDLDQVFGQAPPQRKTSGKVHSGGDESLAETDPAEEELLEKKTLEAPSEKEELELGRRNLEEMIQKQLYRYFDREKFYLYVMCDRRRPESPVQAGLICTIHYEEYKAKNIKVHEKTLSKTIARLKKLYCALGAYTGFPILFSDFGDLYADIHAVVEKEEPILKVSMEGVDHLVFQVPDSLDQRTLDHFRAVQSVYVADGHHRLEAYTSLIDSFYDKSNPHFSFESIFVKDPNRLPSICRMHSKALIEKSMASKENQAKLQSRKPAQEGMSLIIREKGVHGKDSECRR